MNVNDGDVASVAAIGKQAAEILEELAKTASLGPGKLVVIGVSTSEVAGMHIGTAGAEDIAESLYAGLEGVRSQYGFDLAFQCCEHLNRALVVERRVLEAWRLTEVSAVPVRTAGGSMAACAYRRFTAPCLAEEIEAHAGLDIGETLIGMHLRHVAVPYRPARRSVGQARVTAAWTRPKLIGGQRAVYTLPQTEGSELCD
ncbi:TIGR01440 family protein [Paenibacillus sp. CAA11]|uniref:TIGR01440 family protein n=1 Tax=Paenibacillus sp. CAA11 TaxID=1532905 RepID=UPI000D377BE6|nr:TIGR01440 family protein [Paenibacillus sp. CAA11]AWB46283.1 TIGR01440 family protein [Paenibacillus sp. CAA11]